jgi:hypothetical protein
VIIKSKIIDVGLQSCNAVWTELGGADIYLPVYTASQPGTTITTTTPSS